MERQQMRAELSRLQEAHAAEQGALHAQLASLQVGMLPCNLPRSAPAQYVN